MQIVLHTDRYGTRKYYLGDTLHCVDGPAVEYPNGDKGWYLKGKRHRVDGPAIEFENGFKLWYLNGKEMFNEKEFKRQVRIFLTKD